MAQEPIKPRFEVTKELEKEYRNAQIIPRDSVTTTLQLDGRVVGDFIKLAQKHPEYFANPQEAKALCQSVFSEAKWGINASDKRFKLIIAPPKDEITDFGAVVLRVQKNKWRIQGAKCYVYDKVSNKYEISKSKRAGRAHPPILARRCNKGKAATTRWWQVSPILRSTLLCVNSSYKNLICQIL